MLTKITKTIFFGSFAAVLFLTGCQPEPVQPQTKSVVRSSEDPLQKPPRDMDGG